MKINMKYFAQYLEAFDYSRTQSRQDVRIIGQCIIVIGLSVGPFEESTLIHSSIRN